MALSKEELQEDLNELEKINLTGERKEYFLEAKKLFAKGDLKGCEEALEDFAWCLIGR